MAPPRKSPDTVQVPRAEWNALLAAFFAHRAQPSADQGWVVSEALVTLVEAAARLEAASR